MTVLNVDQAAQLVPRAFKRLKNDYPRTAQHHFGLFLASRRGSPFLVAVGAGCVAVVGDSRMAPMPPHLPLAGITLERAAGRARVTLSGAGTSDRAVLDFDGQDEVDRFLAALAASTESATDKQTRTLTLGGHDRVLRGAYFLGGTDIGLLRQQAYDVWFIGDRMLIDDASGRVLWELPIRELERIEISGRGTRTTDGGFIGGGFGLVGAAEGMAIAGVLNAITRRSITETLLTIASQTQELWFLSDAVEPRQLRIDLADVLLRVTSATRSTAVTPPAARSLVDDLRQLADLRDQGVLSEEEFTKAKLRLLASL